MTINIHNAAALFWKHRKSAVAFCLIFVLLIQCIPLSAFAVESSNAVYNGDFSETDNNGLPVGWVCRVIGTQSGSVSINENGKKDTYAAITPDEGTVTLETEASHAIIVKPDRKYTLSWYGIANGNLHIEIDQYMSDGAKCDSNLDLSSYTVSNVSDWKKSTAVFKTESAAAFVIVRFIAEGGNAGIDEVELNETYTGENISRVSFLGSASESQEPELVRNGGYENDLTTWSTSQTKNGATASVDTTVFAGGTKSLKIYTPDNSAQGYVYSSWMDVEATKTYIISYMLKIADTANCDIMIYELSTANKATNRGIITSCNRKSTGGEWEKITVEHTTLSDTVKIRIDLIHRGAAGTSYWDNISLIKATEDTRLFPNGDFKYYTENAGKITSLRYWDISALSTCTAEIESTDSYGNALKISVPANNSVNPRLRHSAIALKAGKTYHISYQIKIDVETGNEACIYMVLRDNSANNALQLLSDTRVKSTGTDWQHIDFEYSVPSGYDNPILDFQIEAKANPAVYSIAEIEMEELVGEDLIQVGGSPDSRLIPNGDFSSYSYRMTSGKIAELPSWNLSGMTGTAAIVQNTEHGNAFKLTADNSKVSQILHNATGLEAGKTYIFSYWIKTDADTTNDASTYLVLWDKNTKGAIPFSASAGNSINTVVRTTNHEWQQIAFFLTIPSGYEPQVFQWIIDKRPNAAKAETNYWFADIKAVETDRTDPGANLDFDAGEAAFNWSVSSSGTGDMKVMPGQSVDGTNALRIRNFTEINTQTGKNYITYASSQKIPVEASATYEISYWVKLEGDCDTNGWVQPVQYNSNDKIANGASFDPTAVDNNLQIKSADITWKWEWRTVGNTDWVKVKRSFVVADDASYIFLRFLLTGTDSSMYIDSVELKKIDPKCNFDFETVGEDNEPSFFYLSGARAKTATVISDTQYYHSGNRSAHIIKDTLTSYNSYETGYRFLVNSGATYEFSFWMMSANADPHANLRMNMLYFDENGNRIYTPKGLHSITYGTMTYLNSSENPSEWTQVMTRSAVPYGAYCAVIQFYMQEGRCDLWLDDVFVDIVEESTSQTDENGISKNIKTIVTEHNDFHAVDQNGNISGWDIVKKSGNAALSVSDDGTGNNYGKLVIRSGESFMRLTTTALENNYTYKVTGKYRSDVDSAAVMEYYNWAGARIENEADSVALPASSVWSDFEFNISAKSGTSAGLLIGSNLPGTIEVDDIVIYMTGKPVTVGNWDGSWIWYQEYAPVDGIYQSRYFRYHIRLDDEAKFAPLQYTADDRYELYVNGKLIDTNMSVSGDTWSSVQVAYLEENLHKGDNVIAFRVYNYAAEAALMFDGKWTLNNGTEVICASDASVKTCRDVGESETWMLPDYNESGTDGLYWGACEVVGKPPKAPWGSIFYNSSIYSAVSMEILSIDGDGDAADDGVFNFGLTIKLSADSPLTSNFPLNVRIWQKNSVNEVSSSSLELTDNTDMSAWPIGKEFKVNFEMSVPFYLESGNYTLQLDDKYISISNTDITDGKFISFSLKQEAPHEASVSKIEMLNGSPTLVVNGELTPFYCYSRPDNNSNTWDYEPSMKKSGIELYTVRQGCLGKPNYDYCWSAEGVVDYDAFDDPIYETLANNSNAYLIVQVGMYAPDWWLQANPGEQTMVSNRTQSDSTDYNYSIYNEGGSVSFGSEKFVQESGEVLRLLMEHMKTQSYYSRIVGINLCSGKSFENMYWGAKNTDYAPDYSGVAITAFRKWLKNRYGTVEALCEAWNDNSVTFTNAMPASFAEMTMQDGTGGYVNIGTQKRILDHRLFLNELVTDRLLYWGNIINEVHDRNIVLGCFNGYLFSAGSYMDIGAQHTSFSRLLEDNTFSFFVSPANYSERELGVSDTYMGFQDTVQAYGKMVVIEEDHRTCLVMHYSDTSWDASNDQGVGGTHTMQQTIYQMKKNVANAMISGNGIWFFDMQGGWFDDDQFYGLSNLCADEYLVSAYKQKELDGSDIAYFVDDEYLSYFLAINDEYDGHYPSNFMTYAGFRLQRKQLARIGQSYDVYGMSTLADGKVKGHKINIIFGCYQLTEKEKAAIEKHLKKDGQIVLFVYAAGVSDGSRNDIALMEDVTGLPLVCDYDWGNISVNVTADNEVTNGFAGRSYGPQGAAGTFKVSNPVIWVDAQRDNSIKVHGSLETDSSKAALVSKDMGDWTCMYSSSPNIPYQILRNLIEIKDGKFLSENPNDIIYNNGAFVALHSTSGGTKTINLDSNYAVYDAFNGKFISMNTDRIVYENEPGDTHLFRLQKANKYEVLAVTHGSHGKVSLSGITEVSPGEDYKIDITPNEGYMVNKITVNGVSVPAEKTLGLEDISENKIIRVTFKKSSAKALPQQSVSIIKDVIPEKTVTVIPDTTVVSEGTVHEEKVPYETVKMVRDIAYFALPAWLITVFAGLSGAVIALLAVIFKKRKKKHGGI